MVKMHSWRLALLVPAFLGGVTTAGHASYKYVAMFSIDGFHGSDVGKYLAQRPNSTIAKLIANGYEYTNAFTSAPSDSFPGTINQATGASPRTTGVWYDTTYDRTYFAPGSNCTGPPGSAVVYDETIDFNSTALFSGGIDVNNLPRAIVNGACTAIYPHSRLRVNTIFEVVHEAGLETAYADKHPAYDIVRGPSGAGLTTSYFPEINAVPTEVNTTIAYDQLHVNAFLSWLDAQVPANSTGSLQGIPALFGGNFQAVSVAQKTVGYVNGSLDFTPTLLEAIDFVDSSLGQVVDKLVEKNIYNETLIIVASKHGQAPIDPTKFGEVDPTAVTNATKVDIAYQTSDDIALIFLNNKSDTQTAVQNLSNDRTALKIRKIISGQSLIDQGFGDPTKDPAVPDIIVAPQVGIIYTTSQAKIAEHGGLSNDDRHVACFVSNPNLKKTQFKKRVSTKQVATTVLAALGLDVGALQGAVAEGTQVLDGF